jgi:ribosomal-protein-alanine N-acetyltransferase
MAAFETIELHTQRLMLRPIDEADAPALLNIYADPEVMRYGSGRPWSSLQVSFDYIERCRKEWESGCAIRLAMVDKREGKLLGTCGLFNVVPEWRRAELGFALARNSWGHRYGTEAARELLDFGFTEIGLNRVEAHVDPDNIASRRCVERLGFLREGLARERIIVGNRALNSLLYGLLRSDWEPPEGITTLSAGSTFAAS